MFETKWSEKTNVTKLVDGAGDRFGKKLVYKQFSIGKAVRLSPQTQVTMSVAALVGPLDDIVRSTAVLTEGIEGGSYPDIF